MEETSPSTPRRYQTRLGYNRKLSTDNNIQVSPSKRSDGDPSPSNAVRSESFGALPLERFWTHTSQVLRGNQKKNNDQILLDQLSYSAEEVRDTKWFEQSFHLFRGPLTSYNSIRETYHLMKEASREKDRSTAEKLYKSPILFITKIMITIRTFFRSTKRILLVTFLDFFVDMIFCLAYLVEVHYNFYNQAKILESREILEDIPSYLCIYRPDSLFMVIFVCAIWSVVSWLIRMTYVSFDVLFLDYRFD